MTTTATAPTKQAAEVSALLERASKLSGEAMCAASDVVSFCTDEADGEALTLEEAHALLGQAHIARKWAEWALDETDKAIKELVHQVFYAEERVGFARVDAAKEAGDAR